MTEEEIKIDIDGFRCQLPRNPTKNTIHFCLKHNCPYWDSCPICGYEDMAINPSIRELKCSICKTSNEASEHGCFKRVSNPRCPYF